MGALQWIIWGILMTLVMGWLERSRHKKHSNGKKGTLKHPVSTLIIGLVCGVFFFGLAIFSNTIGKNDTTTLWTTLIFSAGGLMAIPLITDYYFGHHQVSEIGFEYGKMFGQRGSFKWNEVQKLKYSQSLKWFVIYLKSGKKVRVSAMLLGLPEFARLVLELVPHHLMDSNTLQILRETKDGKLPGIWG